MIVVPLKEGENIEKALKKFKRKFEKTGIVKELRNRQAFEKPSVEKRKQQMHVSQVLIPTEKTFTVRNGKKVMKERSYLPGYVLVEAVLTAEVIYRLSNAPNVIGFLGGSENPAPLRPAEVSRILGTADDLHGSNQSISRDNT